MSQQLGAGPGCCPHAPGRAASSVTLDSSGLRLDRGLWTAGALSGLSATCQGLSQCRLSIWGRWGNESEGPVGAWQGQARVLSSLAGLSPRGRLPVRSQLDEVSLCPALLCPCSHLPALCMEGESGAQTWGRGLRERGLIWGVSPPRSTAPYFLFLVTLEIFSGSFSRRGHGPWGVFFGFSWSPWAFLSEPSALPGHGQCLGDSTDSVWDSAEGLGSYRVCVPLGSAILWPPFTLAPPKERGDSRSSIASVEQEPQAVCAHRPWPGAGHLLPVWSPPWALSPWGGAVASQADASPTGAAASAQVVWSRWPACVRTRRPSPAGRGWGRLLCPLS